MHEKKSVILCNILCCHLFIRFHYYCFNTFLFQRPEFIEYRENILLLLLLLDYKDRRLLTLSPQFESNNRLSIVRSKCPIQFNDNE